MKDQNKLGMQCVLKCLRLVRGEEPFAYLKFIIVELKRGKYLVTDNGLRVFAVSKKDVLIID